MNIRPSLRVCAALTLVASSAWAAGPSSYEPTPSELAMLPAACQVKLSEQGRKDQAQQAMWSARLGPNTWLHFHHYCHGLKFVNRAQFSINRADRRGNLQAAIGEFDYVLTHWPADSPLRSDAQMRKDLAQTQLRAP